MKILLVGINAKYVHSNPAIYSLKSYAVKKSGNDERFKKNIDTLEFSINMEKGDVIRKIYKEGADVVAFSCYLWNITYVYSIITALNSLVPESDIWLGGPEVSFDPENQLKKYPMVRGILCGEGEEIFYNLAKEYIENGSGNALPPILRAERLDFNEVPFLYDDLSIFDNRILYYESSRGCPFNCSYCLSSVDKYIRLRDTKLVFAELNRFLEAKVKQVKFVDRTFNCNPSHTKDILEYIRDNDNGITNFHFEMAADIINEEEIRIMSSLRPGLIQIEVGIQTTNSDALKAINRQSDLKKLFENVRRILEPHNIHVHVDLIAGLPYEDIVSFRKSFNEVYSLHANELQLGFLKVLKGSLMAEEAARFGIKYLNEPPYEVLMTNWISYRDIIELKAVEEMVEIYYNSAQFVNTMLFLEKYFDDAYSLYKSIADYFLQKGFDTIKLSRFDRYEILRDFALSCGKNIDEKKMTDVLLHDLYLRDNVKNRPSYGAGGEVEKNAYKDFFASGKYKEYLHNYEDYSPVQVSKMVHIEKSDEGYCLYDYRTKDPITGNAKSIMVELGVTQNNL